VYTPPGYGAGSEPCGLALLFDGALYRSLMPLPTILDNLLAERRLPPTVAVLVDSVSREQRTRELVCSEPFTACLARELLPWVRRHYRVSADPARVVVGGHSLGGLAAAYAAFRHADLFGNVLSQSGAFWWWRPDRRWGEPPDEATEYEWLTHEFATHPRRPLRFYLNVGLLESTASAPGMPSMLLANRHLRDVLQAKGYPVAYAEFAGGHTFLCWRGTLADGLLALLGRPRTLRRHRAGAPPVRPTRAARRRPPATRRIVRGS
jgi:enterochelin esterase family protein